MASNQPTFFVLVEFFLFFFEFLFYDLGLFPLTNYDWTKNATFFFLNCDALIVCLFFSSEESESDFESKMSLTLNVKIMNIWSSEAGYLGLIPNAADPAST